MSRPGSTPERSKGDRSSGHANDLGRVIWPSLHLNFADRGCCGRKTIKERLRHHASIPGTPRCSREGLGVHVTISGRAALDRSILTVFSPYFSPLTFLTLPTFPHT